MGKKQQRHDFHVFAYDQYYPSGGIGDYYGSYATLAEAKERRKEVGRNNDFAYVVESTPQGLVERD